MLGLHIERTAPSLNTADAIQTAFARPGTPIGMQVDHSIPKWYFSRQEIESQSPSRVDGIDLQEENKLRRSYCRFLSHLGMRLNVPQLTIATATVFCHRFYLRESHLKNDRYAIATSCMFLACKVEETPVRLANVTIKAYQIRHAELDTAWSTDLFNKEKELVLVGERLVLGTLRFDITIDHPYKPLMVAIKNFTIPDSRALGQVAWSFVNDLQQTTLGLQFRADHIAAGAIFLASKFLKTELSTDREKVWWEGLKVTRRQLEEVCSQILELYEPIDTPEKTQDNHILRNESRSTNPGPSGMIIKYIKRSYF